MLESLAAALLNLVLGSYVENFDPKLLHVGLLSGEIKLGGLKLKRGALDKLQLPIDVVDGYIGSLVLQIPVSNIKSKPVKVLLEDVFLLATPDSGADPQGQERRDLAAKIEKLQVWELNSERAINMPGGAAAGGAASTASAADEREREQEQQSFTDRLLAKIVDNLQVTIRNIHIRLEDKEAGVAMGATLGELSAISTNSEWEPTYIADGGTQTHKLATLDSLAFYIDPDLATEFADPRTFAEREQMLAEFKTLIQDSVGATDVLRPINGQGFITMNKRPASETVPRMHADLKFEEVSVNLDREQYVDILRLVERFRQIASAQRHRRYRPAQPVAEDPLAWFRYAALTVLDEVRERRRRFTMAYLRERLDDQHDYVQLYKKWYRAGGSAAGLAAAEKSDFERIQQKYDYEDLIFFRSLAKKDLVSERQQRKQQPQNQTWSQWLWGSKPAKNGDGKAGDGKAPSGGKDDVHGTSEVDLTAPLEITEEQRNELLNVLDADYVSKDSAGQIVRAVQFSLRSAGVRLKSGGAALAAAGFEGVRTTFVQKPDAFNIEMSVDKILVSDLTYRNQFSDIIRVQHSAELSGKAGANANANAAAAKAEANAAANAAAKAAANPADTPFFWFLFQHHPADRKADSSLFLRSQSIVLVHNARFIESLGRFFAAPPEHGETVDAILLAANRQVDDWREQTRQGLEYALEHHKTLQLQLDVQAPTIVLPLNPLSDESPLALLDVGSLSMNSELVPQHVLSEAKSKQAQQYTAADWKRLESLMYDRFTIKLQDTQILLAQSMAEMRGALGETSSKYHFLDKATLQLALELSIVPQNPSLARSRVSIKLPALRATLSDVHYLLMMKILAAATPTAEPLAEASDALSDTSSETDAASERSVDAKPAGPPQKVFELIFVVDEVRFFVVSGWDSSPVIDMCLHDFRIACWSTANLPEENLAIDTSVRDLLITDHTQHATAADLRKVAESAGHRQDQASENLFRVAYRKTAAGDMSVRLDLEEINFILNPDAVLALYDYVMSTFTAPDEPAKAPSANRVEASKEASVAKRKDIRSNSRAGTPAVEAAPATSDGSSPEDASPASDDRKITVEMNMSRISALLTDADGGIVTMALDSATMAVELVDRLNMRLKLGNVSIVDMQGQAVLSIEDAQELADIRYETLPMLADGVTPSGPTSVYLRMGQVKLNLLEDPLTKMTRFLMRFTAMKAAYDQSRMMAFNQAIQVEPNTFKFDIVVSTPIIVWAEAQNWIRVDLGEVYLQNRFEQTDNFVDCGIRNVRIATSLAGAEQEIVPATDLALRLAYTPDRPKATQPVSVVAATLSPVRVEASEVQYRFVMQCVASLSRISAGSAAATPDMAEVGDLRRTLAKKKHIADKQASYWWGENFSLALGAAMGGDAPDGDAGDGDAGDATAARAKLQLEFVAPSFDILLKLDAKPLTQLAIRDVSVRADVNARSEPEIDFHVRSFAAHNLSGSAQNKFSQVIPPTKHDGYQVMGRFTQRQAAPLTFECSIDSPQVILAVDYLVQLNKFWEHGVLDSEASGEGDESTESEVSEVSEEESAEDEDDDESDRSLEDDTASSASSTVSAKPRKALAPVISVNIVDMYLTVLSDEQDEDSEAIVFKIEQLVLNTGESLTFSLSKVGMFLTRMQAFDASRLRIIDDFSVTASIDNSESTDYLRLANIQASMERLVVRISLREIGLIMNIATKVQAIWSDSTAGAKPRRKAVPGKRASTFFADDHRLARRSARFEATSSNGVTQETITSARVLSEQLTAQFEDIRVVLIDPQHQIPLTDFCIKPFTLVAKNWSDSLSVSAKAELFANVHSFTKSAWEPLVDVMEVGLSMGGDVVELYSTTVADLEVTPETLELVRDIQSYFADSSRETFLRKYDQDGAPYRIRNDTGYPLKIWSDSRRGSGAARRIANGEQISWSFHDWRELRENLNATDQDNRLGVEILADGFESLRSISVSSVGEHLFVVNHNGTKVRLAFDVWIDKHLKYVSIRSTAVVRNHTEQTLELLMTDKADSARKQVLEMAAHSTNPLPLSFVDSRLLVRRKGDTQWSNREIYWRDMLEGDAQTVQCGDAFNLTVIPEIPADPLAQHYPFLFINLSVPFEIINNLPEDVQLRLYGRDTRKELQRALPKAGRALVHDFNDTNLLLMRVDIEGFTSSKFAVINTGRRFSREFHREDKLELTRGHQRLELALDFVDLPQGQGKAVVIYAPYVIVNSTDHEFQVAGNLNRVICAPGTATLWSSGSLNKSGRQKVTFAERGSLPSASVFLDASGASSEVSLLAKDRQQEMHFGVSVAPGTGRYVSTKVVTVAPRFILVNAMARPLEFREPGGKTALSAEPGARVSVNYMWTMAAKEMCTRFGDSERAEFSSGFSMANVGKSYVRLIDRGRPTVLARVEVILEGATFFVHFTVAKSWPYSIRNFTDREFVFYQTDPLVDEDGAELLNHAKEGFTPLRYRIPPRSAMPYSWDFPAADVKQLVLELSHPEPELPARPRSSAASVASQSSARSARSAQSTATGRSNATGTASGTSLAPTASASKATSKARRRKVQLAEIGELPPAKFGNGFVVDLSVIADGPQQALVIAPHNPEASTYDTQNNVKSEAIAEVEAVDTHSGFTVKLELKGIGISCITPQAKELVYVTLRNIKASYHVSDALETVALQVQWIQVDNTLKAQTDFPVVIYPTVLPKAAAELAAHPCFSTSLTRVRDDSFGVAYVKHATLLLQEMTIETDEDFLLGVAELVVSLLTANGVAGAHHRAYAPLLDDDSVLCGEAIAVPEPRGDTTPDIYFEQLHLQPVQLNLSFVRTGSLSSSAIFKDNNAAGTLAFVIDALTLTIGNVNDAPLRFNALLVDNVRTQVANLARMIQMHYQQEFLYQIHKILGSADIIGNPVGLFNNISSGVVDLFYEPYLGYTLNDRPQEFGIGLAKGGLSFMKKSVFGVSDSISKVTGSLSKGLSAVTLDTRYQTQRQARRTRNRPRHAVSGLRYGLESFYDSFASGVVGLAEQPMQGAVTNGGAGFFRGLGMGLLGLPTKTTIGILDMASNITEGIRNTTTVFDAHEIRRVRLPRVISSDGIVRPYNVRESVGQMILHSVKDGRYAKYHYLAHSNITRNKVIVVTLEVLLVAAVNDMSLEWSLSYDQVQSVTSESTGIAIELVNGAHGPFVPLSDAATRAYIYKNIAKGVDSHNQRQLLEAQ